MFNSTSLKEEASFRLPSNHAIKNLESARRGDLFLTNSADRVVRVFHLREVLLRGKQTGSIEPIQKLQDMVNKIAWKTCCLSGDGQFVCSGTTKQNSLYIHEQKSGSLVKILNGTKGEQLMDAQWHPARPLICSVSHGTVSIWAQSHVENWSAFAPDFKELDENVEYEERESEFDLEDEDRSVQLNTEKSEENEEVDVTTVMTTAAVFCSSDEDDDGLDAVPSSSSRRKGRAPPPLWYLPITPEIEAPEETTFPMPGISDHSLSGTDQNRPPSDQMMRRAQRPKEISVELKHPAIDEVHPLLAGPNSGRKKSQEHSGRSNSSAGRPPSKQRKMPK